MKDVAASHGGTSLDCIRYAKAAVLYDPTRIAHPKLDLFDPHGAALKARAVHTGGRQAAWFVGGAFGMGVLRYYRRGGLVAHLTKDRYLWLGWSRTRSFAELRLLARMVQDGLAVPRPLAAAVWRHGLTYRAAILIEQIETGEPFAKYLQSPPQQALCHRVARSILDLHQYGYYHADLNAYNILIDHQQKAWLIDFDKSWHGALTLRLRQKNLWRLRRSLIKVAGSNGLVWWKGINLAYETLLTQENRCKSA